MRSHMRCKINVKQIKQIFICVQIWPSEILHLMHRTETAHWENCEPAFLAHFAAGRRKVCYSPRRCCNLFRNWLVWLLVSCCLRQFAANEVWRKVHDAHIGWLIFAHSQPPANPFDVGAFRTTDAAAHILLHSNSDAKHARVPKVSAADKIWTRSAVGKLAPARCPAGRLIDWHNLPKLPGRADRIALLKQMASLFSVRRLITFLLHASAHSLISNMHGVYIKEQLLAAATWALFGLQNKGCK